MEGMFAHSSKTRLTDFDLDRFAGTSLFDRLGRTVCRARCLPRKEFYESWQVARRVRRLFRGGRVVDLGGGHGLLALIMLVLDDSSTAAVIVDKDLPSSFRTLHSAFIEEWPRLAGRVSFVTSDLDEFLIESSDIVMSSHACGLLTDRVLERAVDARARVAVLPCCHDFTVCDTGGLTGWIDPAMAIDVVRATRLVQRGYRIWTQSISADVTAKNRLLLGSHTAPIAS